MTLSELDQWRLKHVLTDAEFDQLPGHQHGKVRESYNLPDGRRVMIATDRQSAFDHVLAAVPDKGHVLTATAQFWFEQTADVCPNHVIAHPDPNVIIARRLTMLPVEMVVRAYITGTTDTSIWTMYAGGERTVYGHTLPGGLKKNDLLPEVLITPTTKGAVGAHDHPITADEIVAQGLLTQAQWDEAAAKSLALFARGREIAAKNGLILVDTKYEFGLDENGVVTIADEIHTPDSSRYWDAASYPDRHAAGEEPENLDKEFLRLWIRERCNPYTDPLPDIPGETLIEFSNKYVSLYERVTGRPFERTDPKVPVRERIQAALAKALPEYF
ncbi:MAG: phosphoribosylaminoimidazolesuccinocarboxamide synthase [Rhodospirillales bacterium]|nr:phosphoribosylaminoimidazolesuccinocarboxamide synthase [Rhodospirillales bacterium]MBO6787869.1 phosphoribosylaminoimidazolesuccinocarboxamide synthase [Rhodospirillales bacterium]